MLYSMMYSMILHRLSFIVGLMLVLGLAFGKNCPPGMLDCDCFKVKALVECNNRNFTGLDLKNISLHLPNYTVTLDLSNNKIESFVEFDTPMEGLEHLNLAHNLLPSVPRKASIMFQNLNTLDLSFNLIESIHKEDFKDFDRLRKIQLDNNQVSSLAEESFAYLYNVGQIYMKSNRIGSLSSKTFVGASKKLVKLEFSNNLIKEIPDGLFHPLTNPNLNFIFPFNKLTEIPDSIFSGEAKHFEGLELSNNSISKIGENAFKNVKIGFVNLANNSIEKLPVKAFTQNFIFGTILIMDNPISCECDLAQIVIYTKNQTDGNLLGFCTSPIDLNGTPIHALKVKTDSEIREALCDVCELNNTCLNEAECVAINKTTSFCQCGSEFTGDRCENVVKSEDDHTVVVVVVVILILIALAALIAIFIIKRRSAAAVKGQGKDQPDSKTKLIA